MFFYPFTGIIPTRVGTSKHKIMNMKNALDHPHACGDKYDLTSAYPSIMGSSPRVWGQEYPKPPKGDFEGIIPTRVGTRC